MEKLGVVLAGHGVPALDCPPRLIGELMALEWGDGGHGHGGGHERAKQLDAQIRNWPRPPGKDPYKEGLERLAQTLKPMLPSDLFAIGYNEFCAPSVPEAIEQVIQQGAQRVLVIPSMLTPGGLHSEIDIPKAIAGVQKRFPQVKIEYVWPFDLKEVAGLLAQHLRQVAKA